MKKEIKEIEDMVANNENMDALIFMDDFINKYDLEESREYFDNEFVAGNDIDSLMDDVLATQGWQTAGQLVDDIYNTDYDFYHLTETGWLEVIDGADIEDLLDIIKSEVE